MSLSNLGRHDLFYRVVCHPLPFLKASEFIAELDALIKECTIKNVDSYDNSKLKIKGKKYVFNPDMLHGDTIPLELFTDHFKDKPLWKDALDPEKGAIFTKLLAFPGIFVKNTN